MSEESPIDWFNTHTKTLGKNADSSALVFAAVSQDRPDVLELFAAHGMDAKKRNEAGETLMHLAASQGSLKVMRWLRREYGFDINEANGKGDTPICIAAGGGHIDTVKWLLDSGVDINSKGQGGDTPMHQAARNGRIEVMKYLEGRGADISLRNSADISPLESAVETGQTDSIRCLAWGMGVDVNAKGKTGKTAMFAAAAGGKEGGGIKSIECLKELGADVNAKDDGGATPIFAAIDSDNLEGVKYLADNGADLDVKTQDMTPLDFAIKNGRDKIAEYLRAKAAGTQCET